MIAHAAWGLALGCVSPVGLLLHTHTPAPTLRGQYLGASCMSGGDR